MPGIRPSLGGFLFLFITAAALGCSGDSVTAPPAGGTLEISTATTGAQPDPDGYTLQVDGGAAQPIGVNAVSQKITLTPGNHTVQLAGIAANCTLAGDNPRTVGVVASQNATASFVVTCSAITGDLLVTTTTTGPFPDEDGYRVAVDYLHQGGLGATDMRNFANLTEGDYAVSLSGVAANCQVQGDNPHSVHLSGGSTATASFVVTCPGPLANAGALRVTTATTGADPDQDGYVFVVDDGAAQPIGANAAATLSNEASGQHSLSLSGLRSNCTVQGGNPRSVTLAANDSANVLFTIACMAIAAQYHAVDLGTLGGSSSYAYQINNAGQVVGFANFISGPMPAFIWQDGVMTDLGNLPGRVGSEAHGINGRGQVVGPSGLFSGELHAFLWQGGNMTDLGSLGMGTSSIAEAINDAGQVVGWSLPSGISEQDADYHAFIYDGVMHDLGTLDGHKSKALAISSSGQVVGYATNALGRFRAFSWQTGVMTSLGTLGGDESLAFAINNSGQVVGRSEVHGGEVHPFLWKNGVMSDLDTGPGGAYGINSAGQLAGARTQSSIQQQAVFWENGVMMDLPTLGGEGSSGASGINDAGQIVGWSLAPDGNAHATLWTR